MAQQKSLYLHHQGEFHHNYCAVVSLHDSDHDGIVRISVDLCLRAVRFDEIRLDYEVQFFPYQECNINNNKPPGRGKIVPRNVTNSPWWWRYEHFCLAVGRHCSSAPSTSGGSTVLRKGTRRF